MTGTIENIIEEIRERSTQIQELDPDTMPHVVVSKMLEECARELWETKDEQTI